MRWQHASGRNARHPRAAAPQHYRRALTDPRCGAMGVGLCLGRLRPGADWLPARLGCLAKAVPCCDGPSPGAYPRGHTPGAVYPSSPAQPPSRHRSRLVVEALQAIGLGCEPASLQTVHLMTRNGNQVEVLIRHPSRPTRSGHTGQHSHWSGPAVGLGGLEPPASSLSAKCR